LLRVVGKPAAVVVALPLTSRAMEPEVLDRPAVLDELARVLRDLPPLGGWIEDATCATLGVEGAEVFTADHPDPDELDLAEATCWRCPVRQECADYAAQTPAYGLWGAEWHSGRHRRARAA
jgi:hypothetical protein